MSIAVAEVLDVCGAVDAAVDSKVDDVLGFKVVGSCSFG